MVEKKEWFFLSYISAFLLVYLLFTAYMIIPNILNVSYPVESSFIESYNSTAYGLTSLNTVSTSLPLLGILIVIIVIVAFFMSISMSRAME